MFSGTAHGSHQVCQFFLSVLCVFFCVRLVDKHTAVVCCLLATSAIMLSEKKKGNRKINDLEASLNARVASLLSILECWVPWDDAIVVSAGKLRKVWDTLSELCSFQCEIRLERTVLRPALLPVKTAQFTQFFRQVRRYTVKSLSLTESV
jgi:hypothetical protein